MESAFSHRSPELAQREPDALSYRCVCGSDVQVTTVTGGDCSTCGRHYASRVLDSAAAQTYTFHGSSFVPDEHADKDDLLIGQRFGHYRVIERLGRGGMGSVYRALDESLQRYVALKVLRTSRGGATDTEHVQRLLQEAIAQARVNHPHVVHIYFVGRQDDLPFLAMELVPGNTVAQMLTQGCLPFGQVVDIALQIVSALGHCASFDIVHGDIKPSNILAASSTVIKLADFGLAQRMSQLQATGHKVAGTPNYLAPELGIGAAPDIRSDMYALGVTLFEMTFGRLPYSFSGSAIEDRLRAHRQAAVEFPESWPAEVPLEWRDVLARLLAKGAADRYANYADLAMHLEQLRPKEMPSARRVPRFLAAAIDLIATAIAIFSFTLPIVALSLAFAVSQQIAWQFLLFVISSLTLLGLDWAQVWWRTSPGKLLFQIRIVDRHGLAPSPRVMWLRFPFQILPVVGIVACDLFLALNLSDLGWTVTGLSFLAYLIDGGFVLISPQGQSLHDRLCGTRVSIDTRG